MFNIINVMSQNQCETIFAINEQLIKLQKIKN